MTVFKRDRREYDPRAAITELRAALGASQMTIDELWLAYVSMGVDMSRSELKATFAGSSLTDQLQYEVISEALNEHLREADVVSV